MYIEILTDYVNKIIKIITYEIFNTKQSFSIDNYKINNLSFFRLFNKVEIVIFE